ncbi:hypothetical protein LNTAR_22060 [Lentisphaera araneosa HTCC2155]|uniref:Uncharacterized protein n=1 Tax=Lentisphaera araneosa HTCC2155 TaxID=313628 RepID=A6DSM3_9BACT|nr:right-handed parallel beta-helix repeat-containing protein [Lentisphaera araneosa]EDM25376.1 hypothetical protein LNTAR_22060 [Lentisphaera araneosa HTCC2155]
MSLIKILFFTSLFFCGLAKGENYYLAQNGTDANPGTKAQPFGTFAKAAKVLKAGDSLFIREGRYRNTMSLQNLYGQVSAPIIIKSYQGEKVFIDGTYPIQSKWTLYKENIYVTTLDRDIWQVFVNKKMMMPARWPNARLDDGSVWEQDKTWAHGSRESEFGKMVTRLGKGRTDLAATNFDFTGAMAVLNIGKYQTHSRRVLKHQAGSNEFTYQPDNPVVKHKVFWDDGYWEETQRYYLEAHINCLDAEGEWYYNPETKKLYLWAPGGKKPKNVTGQIRDYGLKAENVSHVILQGINFFGCTFYFNNATNCHVQDCRFTYYEHSKRMLGVEDPGLHDDFTCSTRMLGPKNGSWNNIVNCTFSYCDGGGLEMSGKYNRLENILAHDIDWSGVGYHSLHLQHSEDTIIRRVTAYNSGASEFLNAAKGSLIELCDLGKGIGSLQQDGASIQLRPHQHFGTIVRKNWIHDNTKFGIRADIAGELLTQEKDPTESEGSNMTVHNNVLWGIKKRQTYKPAIHIEGDRHMVYNNTSFANEIRDICLPAHSGWGNKNTITRNNVTGPKGIGLTRFDKDDRIPGQADRNWMGKVQEQLRDSSQRDFRPRKDSELIAKAYTVQGLTESFWMRRGDLGAYDHDCENYWIPGFQSSLATHPIPADFAKAKIDSDLIWRQAWQSDQAFVYFGEDKNKIQNATASSPELLCRSDKNIVKIKQNLIPNKTYYWRVDAIHKSGKILKGKVWSFVTQ